MVSVGGEGEGFLLERPLKTSDLSHNRASYIKIIGDPRPHLLKHFSVAAKKKFIVFLAELLRFLNRT